MRQSSGNIRFEELDRFLLRNEFERRFGSGSHVVYRRDDGLRVTVVRPHGGQKAVSRGTIREVLALLDAEQWDRGNDEDGRCLHGVALSG